jgi:hypothetical protein
MGKHHNIAKGQKRQYRPAFLVIAGFEYLGYIDHKFI